MNRSVRLAASAALAGLVLVGSALAVNAAPTPPSIVKPMPAQILTNAKGMTLYLYTPDKKNKSVCSGDCAEYWPPATVPKGTTVPSTIAGIPGAFATTTRADGSLQLTYDGAPLYTWIKDKKPGDMTGQGIGGVWWVLVTSTKAGATVASDAALVKAAPAHLLANQQGMTLYLFTPDKPNKSNCSGACAQYWPPMLLPAHYLMHSGSGKGAFGIATRKDGGRQLTYDGAPLYTWIKDKKPGDITGQGVEGVWWVVVTPS